MRDVAIVGYFEVPPRRRSGRSIYALATEAAAGALASAGLTKDEVDGFAVTTAFSAAGEPFWSNRLCDFLGLTPRWCQTTDLGGASVIASVARAATMIRAGWCSVVLILGVDTPTTQWTATYGGYRAEFEAPYGPPGPLGLFAMLQQRYAARYHMSAEALAKIAIVQRGHAALNPNALYRAPLTLEDYFRSPMISDPIRMLDSVANCDGGGAVVLTSASRARVLSVPAVFPTGYSEVTNFNGADPCPDVTETGFRIAASEALDQAGLAIADIQQFHPYDDFSSAVFMQFGQIGFCRPAETSEFVLGTDLTYRGALPLNTGGGQLSCGQPGLAGGVVNLIEALRQLRGEAGERQVPRSTNAVVTGMGSMQYVRNWGTSAILILEA